MGFVGFRDNKLPTEIYIHPFHLNTQAKFHTITNVEDLKRQSMRIFRHNLPVRNSPGGEGKVLSSYIN